MNLKVALLIAVGLVQLAMPGWMIFEQEQTLRFGTEYRFQTEPVDPYDIFRGRYVALRFTAAEVVQKRDPQLRQGDKVYVTVKTNADGFAEVEQVSTTPIKGDNVFCATVRWWGGNIPGMDGENKLHLEFPFDKYFMEETRAPAAEKAYRAANRQNSEKKAWAVVRLWHGNAALADLVIDGQPIRDYLRDHPQPK